MAAQMAGGSAMVNNVSDWLLIVALFELYRA
jgi:hypothetical protein